MQIGVYQFSDIVRDRKAFRGGPLEDDLPVGCGKAQVTCPVTVAVCLVPFAVGFFAGFGYGHQYALLGRNVLLSVYDIVLLSVHPVKRGKHQWQRRTSGIDLTEMRNE